MRLSRPALVALVLSLVATQVAGATASRFSVSPHATKATGKVTVTASHLSPRSQYILLYVPQKNQKLERFLGVETTDARGSFSATLKLPPVAYCGPASVVLSTTRKTIARAAITVTGCNPKAVAPPPPPHR